MEEERQGMQYRYEQALLTASDPFKRDLASWLTGVGPEWNKYINVFTEKLGLTSLAQLDSMDENIELVVELFKESGVKFFTLRTIRTALQQRVEDARCKAKSQKRKASKLQGMPGLVADVSDDEEEAPITSVSRRLRQSTITCSSSVS